MATSLAAACRNPFPTSSFIFSLSIIFLSLTLITGCDSVTEDTTPPIVISVSPADKAKGVSVNTTITATFSEPMALQTINTSTFTVSGGVTGKITYSGDSGSATATFTPSGPLSYNTTYTVTITGSAAGALDSSGNAMASNYTWSFTTWSGTQQLGTTDIDEAHGVALDSTGNIYVTGYTRGGLDGNTNAGLSDIFLTKYDISGVKQWTKQLGTASEDVASGVTTDSSGNIYVTGFTYGRLDGNTNTGSSDIFLTKFDSSGVKQWTRQLGTASSDSASSVSIDSSGNIYVAGYTDGSLDGNTNAGLKDIFLTKYDSSGVKQWTKQIGTPAIDEALGVATDSNGNIYITGDTSGGLGNIKTGLSDLFLVKFDSFGNKLWTEQLGTTNNDVAWGVSTDSNGNIYLTGDTSGGLDWNINADPTGNSSDIFLVKYDPSGVKQWTKQIGTASDDSAQAVAADSSGNIYVTGFTSGDLDGNTNSGLSDIFLVKYDSSGAKQWTKQIGTPAIDIAYGVATDSSSNIYLTGFTSGDLDGNTNAGLLDIFLVKYDSLGAKQ